ncbi:MAG: peptidyl-prolyl cis-trans isomerase [Deltaproteobacteria bacterium]|nr:peptidyl-prolyl cis-trans isomerase [Deltaproteobacteria bacterium]
MRRFTSALILASALLLAASAEAAWWGRDDTLVSIDGTRYTTEEFKRWWGFWKEDGLAFPKTPEPYIEWLLLVREAERMELGGDPAFQRGLKVFLQSRALGLLKYEAVDSQIKISDEEIKARYDKQYSPRWLIERLQFKDEAAAAAAYQALAGGSATVETLLGRTADEGGLVHQGEDWVRPLGVDPGWIAVFQGLKPGETVDPTQHKGGPILYRLKDRKEGDEEDYAKLKESLRRDIWREKESALTGDLLAALRKKYEVKVDEERLEALDLKASDDALTDAVVISSTQQKITEREFMIVIRRLMGNRPAAAHAANDEKEARKLKKDTVDNIMGQKVVDWEALYRHFEKKEPFKWEYEFAARHRLTAALEARLFTSNATVSDAEIKEFYEKNLPRYTQPETVKLVIIDDTQGPVAKVWTDVAAGADFAKAVKNHFGKDIPAQEVPTNHLDPDVKKMVEKLARRETSVPFTAQGSQVVVHLIDRTPAKPVPLKQAEGTIRETLVQEKVARERKAYLNLLKSRSKIEVREAKWQAIQKELGGQK